MNSPKSSDLLTTIDIETGPNPSCAVIWLHGVGANGHDFAPVVKELDVARLPATRFVFPHAEKRPLTLNGGYVMPAWFDVLSEKFPQKREDTDGVRRSARQIEALIARENARGIADENIVLAGFSQGGALALHVGLRHPRRLAGIIALSTYLLLPDTLAAEAHAANRKVPIFMGHGRNDTMLPYQEAGRDSADLLLARGYSVAWHSYVVAHSVCAGELRDIAGWLREVLVVPR